MNSPLQNKKPEQLRKQALLAVGIGNGIEWYDFAVYGYLAVNIASNFFPGHDPASGLLATFAVFAVAFFFRPIGGLIFGSLGDRLGRKTILVVVVSLMALATFLIGILPTYATLGIAAPIFLILIRCLQGLSAGGEYGGAATFLAEYAEPTHRGRMMSIIPATSYVGLLTASLLIIGLRATMTVEQFDAFGWRIPFLIALPAGLIALFIRMRLEETPEFKKLEESGEKSKNPLRESLAKDWRSILVSAGLVVLIGVGTYTITTYLATYFTSILKFNSTESLWLISAILVSMIVALPFAGIATDKVGRRPVLIASTVSLILFSYPLFRFISSGTLIAAFIGSILIAMMFCFFQGAAVPAMTELFSTKTRYSGFSIGYNISITLFGGTAPYLATYLIASTGNTSMPAWMLVTAAVVALIFVLMIRETAPRQKSLQLDANHSSEQPRSSVTAD